MGSQWSHGVCSTRRSNFLGADPEPPPAHIVTESKSVRSGGCSKQVGTRLPWKDRAFWTWALDHGRAGGSAFWKTLIGLSQNMTPRPPTAAPHGFQGPSLFERADILTNPLVLSGRTRGPGRGGGSWRNEPTAWLKSMRRAGDRRRASFDPAC